MVFHRYAVSASLSPDGGILFSFFFFSFFYNEQKRGRRIRASLRSDPSRDPRVLFDGTLRRFQSISRRNSKRNTIFLHHDTHRLSPTVCVFTRARAYAYGSFPFKYLPTKRSSPPLLADQDENCDRREREETVVGRKKLFPYFEREFFYQLSSSPKTVSRAGVTGKVRGRNVYRFVYRRTSVVDKIGRNYWRALFENRVSRRLRFMAAVCGGPADVPFIRTVPVAFRPEWLRNIRETWIEPGQQMDGVSGKEKTRMEKSQWERTASDASAFPFPIVRRLVKNAH